MIVKGLVPIERAARTNSRSFNARISPRTIRAVFIQLVRPMTVTIRMNMPVSGPKLARSGWRNRVTATSSKGRIGSDSTRSVNRIRKPSSARKYPEMTPIAVPMMSDSSIAVHPTAIDARPPEIMLAMISRPRLSVPNGWIHATFASPSQSAT